MMNKGLEKAVEYLKRGRFVVLQDSEDRENEADLVTAPQYLTPGSVQFMMKHGAGGEFCVPMTPDRVEYLELEPLKKIPEAHDGCNMVASVDYKDGGSGVNMYDRERAVYLS